MAPPTFIRCSESEQIQELRNFLKTHGVEKIDKSEVTQENWPNIFVKCIPHLNVCWKNDKVTESQTIELLATISSIVMLMPTHLVNDVVDKLCTGFEEFPDKNRKHVAKLYCLNNLFSGLPQEHHSRYRIYRTLVHCASQLGHLSQISTQTDKVAALLKVCGCTPAECQALWRQMADVHRSCGNEKQATQAMVNLLSTYTDANAADARDDAFKCIVAAIQDSSFLSHNRLLALKPVKRLEGQPVHKLLMIYVSGGLEDFAAFTKAHPKFLSENGLTESTCLNKLRTLSLMEIAENVAELDYETICKKIDLPEDKLEAFIIEAVRQRVITCKLDQINRRLLITGALPRTFGVAQWRSLYRNLKTWEVELRAVQQSLGTMVDAATAAATVAQ